MSNGNTSTMGKAWDLFGKCITESEKLNQFFKMVLFKEVNSFSSTPCNYIYICISIAQTLQNTNKPLNSK